MPKLSEVTGGGKLKLSQVRSAPDFSNVLSSVDAPDPRISAGSGIMSRAARSLGGQPLEEGLIGLGKSLDTGIRGSKQFLTESLGRQTGMLSTGLQAAGLDDAAQAVAGNIGIPLQLSVQRQREQETATRAADESGGFNQSIPAQAGNILGTVAQVIGPGAFLRGSSAGRLFLPKTIAGNMGVGAGVGALQPVAEEGERLQNVAIGTAAGGAGAVIPKVVGTVARPIVEIARRASGRGLSAAEREAGEAILRESGGRQLNITPSLVPGVNRTLGEATMDPGVMALENTLRAGNRAAFDQIDTANNIARVRALREIAGTDTQMAAAKEARDTATSTLRGQAFNEGSEYTSKAQAQRQQTARELTEQAEAAAAENTRLRQLGIPGQVPVQTAEEIAAAAGAGASGTQALRSQLAAAAEAEGGRTAVQKSIQEVVRALDNAEDSVEGLYRVRKTVNDLIEGKAGTDKSFARAATAELLGARELVDSEITRRAPTFANYLTAYRAGSAPVNRMQVGRKVLKTGASGPRDETGYQRLTPGRFSAVVENLDTVAQKATGFAKAKASEILTPDDLRSIQSIQDDMQRQFKRQGSATVGSQTAERGEIGKRIAVRSAARAVPFLRDAVDYFEQQASTRVKERMAYLIANPAEARRVLDAMQPQQRALVSKVLAQLSMGVGTTAPAALSE